MIPTMSRALDFFATGCGSVLGVGDTVGVALTSGLAAVSSVTVTLKVVSLPP